MNTQEKMNFPRWCKELRDRNGLKQRVVAERIGIKPSSYGNVECNNHKSLSRERAEKLVRLYQLNEHTSPTAEQFLAAWEELPQSEYSKTRDATYEQRRAMRSKSRHYDVMRRALIEATTLLISIAPDPDELCSCPEDDDFLADGDLDPCEICSSLRVLGISSGWTSKEDVIAALASIQKEADNERA